MTLPDRLAVPETDITGLLHHHVEPHDLPFPIGSAEPFVAALAPLPADAGTWDAARWLGWSRWHAAPDEGYGRSATVSSPS